MPVRAMESWADATGLLEEARVEAPKQTPVPGVAIVAMLVVAVLVLSFLLLR